MVLVVKYLKNKFGCNFCNNDNLMAKSPPVGAFHVMKSLKVGVIRNGALC